MNFFSKITITSLLLVNMATVFAKQVDVQDGYVREVIPGNTVTSAYMTIKNQSPQGVKFIGATSKNIDRIEIHEHLMSDGMMQMRQKSSIDIGAGESATLQPMGLHLMMFDIKEPIKAGHEVTISLEFENAEPVEVILPVRSIKHAKKHHH